MRRSIRRQFVHIASETNVLRLSEQNSFGFAMQRFGFNMHFSWRKLVIVSADCAVLEATAQVGITLLEELCASPPAHPVGAPRAEEHWCLHTAQWILAGKILHVRITRPSNGSK